MDNKYESDTAEIKNVREKEGHGIRLLNLRIKVSAVAAQVISITSNIFYN